MSPSLVPSALQAMPQTAMSHMPTRIAILGTGLIGASLGMALRARGFKGTILGWDPRQDEAEAALRRGAIDEVVTDPIESARASDVIVLAGPVLTMLDWLLRLAPVLGPHQLVTDVGSVKGALVAQAAGRYNGPLQPGYLPGHPMAGKELGGAAEAEASLFEGAVWIFTEPASIESAAFKPAATEFCSATELPARAEPGKAEGRSQQAQALAEAWRALVAGLGARIVELTPERHDTLCAAISHLPQMLSTALSAMIAEQFGPEPELLQIGGRALREMTRLGASPYSMWRDIAQTNTEAIAQALWLLEQRLAHLRENLRTPELRAEFEEANQLRIMQSRAARRGEQEPK